jgi:hypothetical protein
MDMKALAINSHIKHAISRLKAGLRPISLNVAIHNNPKITLKIDHVGLNAEDMNVPSNRFSSRKWRD